jgi:nucleolar protein 9
LQLFKRNPSFTDPKVKAEMQLQGSLLLQAWLQLKDCPVTRSLIAMPMERLIVLGSDPVASRIIDAFLDEDNKAIPYKDRRTFLRTLIGHYQTLADDRIGSRVAERCWLVADPFLKVSF